MKTFLTCLLIGYNSIKKIIRNFNKRPEDYGITRYEWIGKKLNVYQSVDLSDRNLTELPFDFNLIYGSFDCSLNLLKSLKGSPEEVFGSFDCSNNRLESLKNCPKKIKSNFLFYNNPIKTIRAIPSIDGALISDFNYLEIKNSLNKDLIRLKMKHLF